MKDEQLAVLTAGELVWLEQKHIASNPCYYAVQELLAALADARLEVARLKEERGKWDIDVTMDGDDVIVTVNGEERFRASPEWLETNALYNAYHRLTKE